MRRGAPSRQACRPAAGATASQAGAARTLAGLPRRRAVRLRSGGGRRREPFAHLPETARQRLVARLARRRLLPQVEEVRAGDVRHLRRAGEVDERLGALGGAAGEQLPHAHTGPHAGAEVGPEAGAHEARVHAVGRHAGALQPASQLDGEQDVRQLGVAVGAERPVPMLELEVGEVDAASSRRDRGRGHHARRRAGREQVGQLGGQQEARQVIQGEGQLVPVRRKTPAAEHGAGVVDQHVEAAVQRPELRGDAPYLGLLRQIADEKPQTIVAGRAADLRQHGVATGLVASDHDQRGPHAGERTRGGRPDPGRTLR